jgi:DNA-binding MarR family transcriptional regulator
MKFESYRSFTFYPELAEKFNVPVKEYMVIESIRYLSTANPNYPWCTQTQGEIATFGGSKQRTVERAIAFGISNGLIEREEGELHSKLGIRTTEKWNNAVLGLQSAKKANKKAKKGGESAKKANQSANLSPIYIINNNNITNTKVLVNYEINKLCNVIFDFWNDMNIVYHNKTPNEKIPTNIIHTLTAKVKIHNSDINPIIDAIALYAALVNTDCRTRKTLVNFLKWDYESYIPNKNWAWYPFNLANYERLAWVFDKLDKGGFSYLKSWRDSYPIVNYVYEFIKSFVFDESKVTNIMIGWWQNRNSIKIESDPETDNP